MSFQSLVPSNLCPDVTPRSMSLQKHISSDLCPLMSYSELCLQNICSLSSVSSDIIHRSRTYVKRNIPTDLCLPHFGQKGKNLYCNEQPDSHLGYPLISSRLCGFFLAISDLTAVCTILCKRPRIDLWIYFTLIALILIL